MKPQKLYVLMKQKKMDVLGFNKMEIIVFGILKLRIAQPKVLRVVMMPQIQLKSIVKEQLVIGMNLINNALIYLVINSKVRVIVIYISTLI